MYPAVAITSGAIGLLGVNIHSLQRCKPLLLVIVRAVGGPLLVGTVWERAIVSEEDAGVRRRLLSRDGPSLYCTKS